MGPNRRDQVKSGRILVVDDEPAEREGLARLVGQWGYEVETASSGEEALNLIESQHPAVVLTDLVLPEMDGLTLLQKLKETGRPPIVLLVTGHGTVETAVEAMRHGAFDYLTKPVDATRLQVLLEKSIEQESLSREVNFLRHQLRQKGSFGQLVGQSKGMQEVYRWIELAATSTAPVLVYGESGTGKELVARTIHDLSNRRNKPFVAINCAAIPETLIESELFGPERGAFTGATALPPLRDRKEDIGLLARTFIEEFNRQDNRQIRGLTPEAERALDQYRWPGNVREVRNVVQRAVVLGGTGLIDVEHLPENVVRTAASTAPAATSVTPIREMEREMIMRALEETGQDKRRAAAMLGISLKTL